MDHVAGYTVAHDVSARDWQLKKNGGQWLLGKVCRCTACTAPLYVIRLYHVFSREHVQAADGFAPIGPAIVSADELGDPHKVSMCAMKLLSFFLQQHIHTHSLTPMCIH